MNYYNADTVIEQDREIYRLRLALETANERIAKLERQRSEFDCRYAGPYAETSGVHCPMGQPCQSCQLAAAERERDEARICNTIVRERVEGILANWMRPPGGQQAGVPDKSISPSTCREILRSLGPEQGSYTYEEWLRLTAERDEARAKLAGVIAERDRFAPFSDDLPVEPISRPTPPADATREAEERSDEEHSRLIELLDVCGCMDDAAVDLVIEALRLDYTTRPEVQAIRVLLEDRGLMEHGTSIRGAWRTDKGEKLLSALTSPAPAPTTHAKVKP